MDSKKIFLSFPHLGGNEMHWIEEAFKDLPTTVSYTLLRDNVMKLSSVKERAAEKKIEQAICEGIVKKNDYGYYLPVKIPENEQLPF